MQATELTLFHALCVWTNAELNLVADEHSDSSHVKRRVVAQDMTKHIQLERISPPDLSTIVEPSGLVTSDQLLQAYKSQALGLVQQYSCRPDSKRFIKSAVWQSSSDRVLISYSSSFGVELLQQDAVIRSGACIEWTIKFHGCCGNSWMGVASTAHEISTEKFLGSQEGGWAYGSDGSVYHANSNKEVSDTPPRFSDGAEITMKLDLRGRGTLEATISGKSFLLFSNMLDAFREDQEVGFLPAVSLVIPGRARFIGSSPVN